MKTAILALCLVVAFATVPTSTLAEHESTDCVVGVSEPDVEVEGFAIFIDGEPPLVTGVWIYEESNGIDGIQRDDATVQDELCGHDGDTVIL